MKTTTAHRHSSFILERARQDAAGETTAGWWKWEGKSNTKVKEGWFDFEDALLDFSADNYRYSMTAEHPSYRPKLKLKLVKMQHLPSGAVVQMPAGNAPYVVFRSTTYGYLAFINKESGERICAVTQNYRIAEQKGFTYWGGGACPVPEGLKVEAVLRSGDKNVLNSFQLNWKHYGVDGDADIIAYRIIGLAEGYTDDPALAK